MLRSLCGAFAAFSCVAVLAGCGRGPIAVVQGQKIGEKEFHAELERQAGRDALRNLIIGEMITREAAAQGIVVPEERLNEDMRRAVEQAGGPAVWKQELERRGLTEEAIRKQRRVGLLAQELMTKGVKVSDQEVKDFFQKNRERYDRPAYYAISEIVLDSKAEADRVRGELKKPGADFATLARQNSVSRGTSATGGMREPAPLEFIQPAVLQPVIKNLMPGQTSAVIPADGLWYIVRLVDQTPSVKGSVRDPMVAQDIKERLRAAKGKSPDKLLTELKAKYSVTILWPDYASLQEEFASAAALPEFGAREKPGEAGKEPKAGPAPSPPAGAPAGAEGKEAKPGPPPAAPPAEKQATTPPAKKPAKPNQ